MNGEDIALPISNKNPAIMKDASRCIQCGYCVRICRNDVTVAKMYDLGVTHEPICINCGQCANYCPTESISERLDFMKVERLLSDPEKIVVVSLAPAVRVALGEEFGLEAGKNIYKKIITALRKLGFKYVFDITFGADLTVMEEALELVDRVKNNKNLPMFTSCCPSWVKYAEIFYPELIPNLSTCKSPIAMQSTTIKTYFAEKEGIDLEKMINVVVAPCTAKKYEVKRSELNVTKRDTDYVLTTRELAKMIKEANIDLLKLEDGKFDSPLGLGSSMGVIFGSSGGVSEAALRTAYHYITGEDLSDEKLVFSNARGMNGIKETELDAGDIKIKVAIVNGMKNFKTLIDKIKDGTADYHFVEVMNCTGGCIAGGGQPKLTLLEMKDKKLERMNGLYNEDEKMKKRLSYKNPEIIKIYKDFYNDKEVIHKYLHTSYSDKSYLLRGEK